MRKIGTIWSHQMGFAGSSISEGFWLTLWSFALALAWLLPNHYPPWAAFHSDAWAAMMLSLASAVVIVRSRAPTQWHWFTVMTAMLLCVPWLQYAAGLIVFAGQAWISTAYLSGFMLALLTGQRWAHLNSDQVADGLFTAIGLAAVLSVYLQFQTWLGLTGNGIFDLWSMGLAGERPYANMGQPNQLATLLLWGLLACAWGYSREQIGSFSALLVSWFLLIGIALTQSRTAWLGLTLMVIVVWIWRRFWRSKWVPWAVTGLFIYFWLCPSLLRELSKVLLLAADHSYFRVPLHGELRPLAWRLFLDAALQQPWFGYGWRETGHAQLKVATEFASLNATFGQSHNLFLDLVLWLGLPLGIFVSANLVLWLIACVRGVTNAQDVILVLFLGVIGIHAMFELPLHYAYFLLPTGLVMGVLNQRFGRYPVWTSPRWTLIAIWLAAVLLLFVIVRDYFRVESSFQSVRFEEARIGSLPKGGPPDVILLTQSRELIRFMRYKPKLGASQQELNWLQDVANSYPAGGVLYKVATALALNGRPDEAQQWLKKICKISSVDECDLIKRVWAAESRTNPLIALAYWPE